MHAAYARMRRRPLLTTLDGVPAQLRDHVLTACRHLRERMQHRSTQKEAVLAPVTRLPLDGGGYILVEEPAGVLEGPVKAGRLGEAIGELPRTLQEALAPVTEAARAALDQLRKARPDEIAVEFGVDLAAQAGAVITKSQAGCHLKVIMSWKMKDDTGRPPHPDEGAG